jgi:hypothetical protein
MHIKLKNRRGGTMKRKETIKVMLRFGLFFLALGGWLLHIRIHPFQKDMDYIIPFILGIVSVFFIPLFFCFRPTLAFAYIFNGFSVIIGTITMAQISIVHFEGPVNLKSIFLGTLLADIAILWGKFALGKALFDLEFLKSDTDMGPKGRFFRYPNMGWWWAHLFALSLVYTLGNILWK